MKRYKKKQNQRQKLGQQAVPYQPSPDGQTSSSQPDGEAAQPAVPRSHRVAQAAYEGVDVRRDFSDKKAYGALAHKLPVLILQNGLAQATGFLLAKGKEENGKINEHLALLDDLATVLHQIGEAGCGDRNTLHQTVIKANTVTTMHLTRRALEVSGWIKRYVQGVLKIDATGEQNNNKDAEDKQSDNNREDAK